MRIIAGVAKGRILGAVAGATRPTSDRAREGLFSSLTSEFGTFEGLHVLDLFGGSGAIGLESLSRGASSVHIVEDVLSALHDYEFLSSDAFVAVERTTRGAQFLWPDAFVPARERKYGQATIYYANYQP